MTLYALSVHADERRRLGERALGAGGLSTAVAAGATLTNFLGHREHLGQALFFGGMSALGYAVWVIQSGAQRRDQLRVSGRLDQTPPVYGVVQWLRHPALTRRARGLFLADPSLGRLGSLGAARDRRHLYPGRPRAVNARFTDDEYVELATAADLAELTPTGFCAKPPSTPPVTCAPSPSEPSTRPSAVCKPNSSKPASRSTSSAPNSTSPARTSEPRHTTSTEPSPALSTRSPTPTAS